MSEPLRPMSTGELLDRTFALYRQHFVLFVGITTLAPAMSLLAELAWSGLAGVRTVPGASMALPVTMVGSFVVTGFAWMIGLALAQAATIRAVSAVHLGQAMGIREAYAGLKGRYLRILGIFLSVSIRVFGGSFVLFVAAIAFTGAAMGGGAILGTAGLVAGGIISLAAGIGAGLLAIGLFVRYSLAVPACVIEDIRGKAALERSIFLSRGSRTRISTVYFVFILLSWVLAGAALGITFAVAAAAGEGVISTAFGYLITFVTGALSGPLATIAISLVYYDERVRKEAFDLQLMMSALEPLPPSGTAAAG